MNNSVITRFPPSPTGLLQAGNARTAVFNYLFARQQGGKFILRIEDTDRERSKKEYEQNIIETLQWLGFEYDAFYRQSDNVRRHAEVLAMLVEKGDAYISRETPTEEGQRSEVVRFKNPNIVIAFTDIVRGEISIDTTDLGDFIIGRSMTEPLYHLGVVVDDFDEGVTHVIRGDDHISNTPRQILILRALDAPIPLYAHLPLVLDHARAKLSKRRGAKAITAYRDEGFLPEAMVNYLALLGWHPEGEQEIFSLEELLKVFDLSRIQKSAGIFDETKLLWFNHEHLKRLSAKEFISRFSAFLLQKNEPIPKYLPRIADLLRERAQTFGEAALLLANGEFSFCEDTIIYEKELLLKGAKSDAVGIKIHLEKVLALLEKLPDESFTEESVKEIIFPYASEVGRGEVLWPMRAALSGKEKSPNPFTLAELVGKEKTRARIKAALAMLGE
jgi:glutamyl-tRNA synthetase